MTTVATSASTHAAVIIPCYNEAGRIGCVVDSIKAVLPGIDIIVIDDASSDSTASEAAEHGAVVLSHGCNLGYGAGLETGYLYAIRRNYDLLVQMDGDGQHPADQIKILTQPVATHTADIAIGSRYGSSDACIPMVRRIGHKFFAVIIRALSGLELTDPTSGFQCMNRKALSLFSSGVFPCDYPDSDVIIMARMSGLKITEIPVKMLARSGGKSMHSGLKPLYYGIKMLLSIFIVILNFHAWRQKREIATATGVTSDVRT